MPRCEAIDPISKIQNDRTALVLTRALEQTPLDDGTLRQKIFDALAAHRKMYGT
jgi:hypothetical protein